MIPLLIVGAACVAMYRVAKMDGANPGLWAGITFALCFGLAVVLTMLVEGGSLIGAFLGLVVSFGIYFAKKMMSDSYH